MCFFFPFIVPQWERCSELKLGEYVENVIFLSNNIKNRMIKIKKNTEIYIYYMLMSIKVNVDCNIDYL